MDNQGVRPLEYVLPNPFGLKDKCAEIAPVMISQFSPTKVINREDIIDSYSTQWDVVQCTDPTVIRLLMVAHEDSDIIDSYEVTIDEEDCD